MPASDYPKVELLEKLRDVIKQHIHDVTETDRAEADLTALSFQSQSKPERHVYITFYNEESLDIDLEDWTTDEEWDHAVQRINNSSPEAALEIVQNWLI
jgi:hypothetical protein